MRVPERRLSGPMLVGSVAAVAGLLCLAALASRAHLFGESPTPLPEAVSRVVVDSLYYLVLVFEAAVLVFLVWVLWPDESGGVQVKRRSLWQTLVAPLAIIALFGSVLLLRDRLQRVVHPMRLPAGQGAASGASLNGPGGSTLNSHSGFDWIAFAAVTVIVAATAAWLIYRYLHRRRQHVREHRRLAEQLEQVMSEGLEELALDPDPRRAVIAAYARMERVLAAHGSPRRPAEAPLEYVQRLLAEVDLSPGLPGRLTDLYQRARFSTHEIDPEMRAEAIGTLEAIREELRRLAVEERARQEVAAQGA